MAKRTKGERREKVVAAIEVRRIAAGRGEGGIVLAPTEFATVILLDGGVEQHIGQDFQHWQAVDAQGLRITGTDRRGRREEREGVPFMLGMGRGRGKKLMAKARDAEALAMVRESTRERKKQRRTTMLLGAHERGSQVWCRDQDVTDQQLRHVLSGTNGGIDPTRESKGQFVCWRNEEGRAFTAQEWWDGSYSEPNWDGVRERIGVETSIPLEWPDSDVARRGAMTLLRLGQVAGQEHMEDGEYVLTRRADKLRDWKRAPKRKAEPVDMKADLEKFRPERPESAPKLPEGAEWARKPPHL